jgi:hypothetical protein
MRTPLPILKRDCHAPAPARQALSFLDFFAGKRLQGPVLC